MAMAALALGLALIAAASPCLGLGSGDSGGTGGASVSSVVTEAFFNGITSQSSKAGNRCEGTNFYTRSAFVSAADSFPAFAHGGTEAEGKREIAAFFAHVTYETGYFCYISQIGKSQVSCAQSSQWPCTPGKKYYGRGPLQISWNFNYGPAGKSIGVDLLSDPDKVAQDPVISFKTALWLWMNNVHQVMEQGFGATVRAFEGSFVCDGKGRKFAIMAHTPGKQSVPCMRRDGPYIIFFHGKNPAALNVRVGYYKEYCKQFGVDPGNNITC